MTHIGLVCRKGFLAMFDRCSSPLPQRSLPFSPWLRVFGRSEPFTSVQRHNGHFYSQCGEAERMSLYPSQAVIKAYTGGTIVLKKR
jgi:hypothetical protein